MFERVVTLAYLAKHTDEIRLFNDFFRIDQRKRVRRHEQHSPGKVSPEFVEEVESEYEEVKDKYMITDCKKCGTKRLNHMWSKKDLVAMAREVGFSFDKIENGYYIPLEEAHPKIDALFNRTKEEDGSVSYDERPDVRKGDKTVMTAAILQMKIFEVLEDYFKIESMKGAFGPYLVGLSNYIAAMRGKIQSGA